MEEAEVIYNVEGCFPVLDQTKERYLQQFEIPKSLSPPRETDVLDQRKPWDWDEASSLLLTQKTTGVNTLLLYGSLVNYNSCESLGSRFPDAPRGSRILLEVFELGVFEMVNQTPWSLCFSITYFYNKQISNKIKISIRVIRYSQSLDAMECEKDPVCFGLGLQFSSCIAFSLHLRGFLPTDF